MKTAAAALQEWAVKLGLTPEYACISQAGPDHNAWFEYRCVISGQSATAVARSKKEAKQKVARAVLAQLARSGHNVPAPWGLAAAPTPESAAVSTPASAAVPKPASAAVPTPAPAVTPTPALVAEAPILEIQSYISLLKEYCEEYKLPAPEYDLVGESGPPHKRIFTMRVKVGAHSREATNSTKKAARKTAAEDLYKYLRGCLRSTLDFVEEDALARQVDKRMNRFKVCSTLDFVEEDALARRFDKRMNRFKVDRRDLPWRPPLSQKLSEYQYGLLAQFEEEKRVPALEMLRSAAAGDQPPEAQLTRVAAALGVEPIWDEISTTSGQPLVTVELPSTSPSLVYMGRTRDDAATHMIGYLNMCLESPQKESSLVSQKKLQLEKDQQLSC